MKRRRFLQALAVTPAVPALTPQARAQQPPEEPPAAPLAFSTPDVAADPVTRFFDARQFRTLRRLSQLFEPSVNGSPSALDARAPEFLDFLLSDSGRERQLLYLNGLDTLEYNAQTRRGKAFAELDDVEAAEIVSGPLQQPWSYVPQDPLVGFLRSAREDVRNATRNSVEWAQSGRFGASGSYWKKVE